MTTKWSQVVRPVRNSTSAGETSDNDVHNCESNNITVHSKNIAKKLPLYKFATLKIFVTPFLCALRHTCTDQFGIAVIYPHLPPPPFLGGVRIPRETAALAHFVAITKGARHFFEWLSQQFELVDRSNSEQFVFLKFQNNFTAEFKTNISYGLLLQWFLLELSLAFLLYQ